MMMPLVVVVVRVAVVAIGAALRLEGRPHLHKICSETVKHILNHMVRADTKNVVSNLRRRMSISEMPGKAHKLMGILMPDLDNKLRGRLNFEPSPVVELQAISIGHCNRFRKVEQDIFALIRSQTNTAAMPSIKVEGESASGIFLRPMPGRSINRSTVNGHINT
jgi:hypothetical protein